MSTSTQPTPSTDRFWSTVRRGSPDACWPWTGSIAKGYGRFGRTQAHRYAYEQLVGVIPEGHDLHHNCENRACCNPAHLEPLPHGQHRTLHLTQQAQAGFEGQPVKKPGVRVTVYLPDDIAQAAKAAGINFSRTLRDAIQQELGGETAGIRSSGRRVKQSVELTVMVPVETIRGLIDDPDA